MKFLRWVLPGWLGLLLTMLGSPAWADGIVFAKAAPTTTPDQRAMLQFSNGVERLVIETSYIGSGTNFAWVVPLPANPKVEAVSTNFFEYLNLAYQPRLVWHDEELWLWVGFLLITFPITTGIWAWRRKGLSGMLWWLGLNGGAFICLTAIVPCFVVARATSAPVAAGSVEVREPATRWDLRHGDAGRDQRGGAGGVAEGQRIHDATALPILSSYATQGWVFVRPPSIAKTESDGGDRPHPLGFTFNTAKPRVSLAVDGGGKPGVVKLNCSLSDQAGWKYRGLKSSIVEARTSIEVATNDPGGWDMQMDLFGGSFPVITKLVTRN